MEKYHSLKEVRERYQGWIELDIDGGKAFQRQKGFHVYWVFETPLGVVLKRYGYFKKIPNLPSVHPPSMFDAMLTLTPREAIA